MKALDKVGEQLAKDIAALQEVAKKSGGTALAGAFADFFAQHMEVEAVRFHQYTPGFNDGEPCVNSLGEIELKLFLEEEYCGGDYSDNPIDSAKLKKEFGELCAMLRTLEDQLEKVFGTNQEITVYRDKVDVEFYDCGY